jgi:hypothetical protein
VQLPGPSKVIGKTRCGAPIAAPFDKEAWARDTSVQGTYTVDGALFGGQVKLDKVVVTKQKSPVASGRIALSHFDLGPIGKLLVTDADVDPLTGVTPSAIGGEVTGDVVVDRISADDIAHAKARFIPAALRVTRGGQALSLRTSPSSAPGVAIGPPIVITLADDDLTLPPVTFDLAAPNGFKGAFGARSRRSRAAPSSRSTPSSPPSISGSWSASSRV